MFWLQIRIPGNSVTLPDTPSLSKDPGKEERRDMLQTEAGQGAPHSPSFSPDEAAPFQKSYEEESHVQIRIGPSLHLAESGWRSTWNDREGGRF